MKKREYRRRDNKVGRGRTVSDTVRINKSRRLNPSISMDFPEVSSIGHSLPLPIYFEDYDLNGDGILNVLDMIGWANYGNPSVGQQLIDIVIGNIIQPPYRPTPTGQDHIKRSFKVGGVVEKTRPLKKVRKGPAFLMSETKKKIISLTNKRHRKR